MYVLVFKTCTGHSGHVVQERNKVFQMWAEYSNALLQGKELNVRIPDAPPDSHIESVSVFWEEEIAVAGQPDRVAISSFFLLCPHDVEVKRDELVVA